MVNWQSAVLRAETDIAIIGSGITGCSVAYHVLHDATAAAGTVTILEARNAVSGATGRNGGHLMSDADAMFTNLTEAMGREQASEILHFTEANITRLGELVQQLDPGDRAAVELRTVTHTTGFDMVRYEAARKAEELAKEVISQRTLRYDIIPKEEAVKVRFISFDSHLGYQSLKLTLVTAELFLPRRRRGRISDRSCSPVALQALHGCLGHYAARVSRPLLARDQHARHRGPLY